MGGEIASVQRSYPNHVDTTTGISSLSPEDAKLLEKYRRVGDEAFRILSTVRQYEIPAGTSREKLRTVVDQKTVEIVREWQSSRTPGQRIKESGEKVARNVVGATPLNLAYPDEANATPLAAGVLVLLVVAAVIAVLSQTGCGATDGCGCPPVYDENDELIEDGRSDAICRLLTEVEQYEPQLTCNVNKVVFLPDQEFEELQDQLVPEHPVSANGLYVTDDNRVILRTAQFSLDTVSPDMQFPDFRVETKQDILHEFGHSLQFAGEINSDEYEARFGDDYYCGFERYQTCDLNGREITDYCGAHWEESQVEWWSYGYFYQTRFLQSNNLGYLARAIFIRDVWKAAGFSMPILEEHPGSVSIEVFPFQNDPYMTSVTIYQDGLAEVNHERFSDGTDIIITPFSEPWEEVTIPVYDSIVHVGVNIANVHFWEDKMVFVGGYWADNLLQAVGAVGIVDEFGGYPALYPFDQNLADQGLNYSNARSTTIIYGNELFFFPTFLSGTSSEVFVFDLETREFDSFEMFGPDFSNIFPGEGQLTYSFADSSNPHVGIQGLGNGMVYVLDLEQREIIGYTAIQGLDQNPGIAVGETGQLRALQLYRDEFLDQNNFLVFAGTLEDGLRHESDISVGASELRGAILNPFLSASQVFSIGETSYYVYLDLADGDSSDGQHVGGRVVAITEDE